MMKCMAIQLSNSKHLYIRARVTGIELAIQLSNSIYSICILGEE
jgi:hypothetical protein